MSEKRVCFHSSLENDRLAPIGAKMKYEGRELCCM